MSLPQGEAPSPAQIEADKRDAAAKWSAEYDAKVRAQTQRDEMGQALGALLVAIGFTEDVPMTGPQLLCAAEDAARDAKFRAGEPVAVPPPLDLGEAIPWKAERIEEAIAAVPPSQPGPTHSTACSMNAAAKLGADCICGLNAPGPTQERANPVSDETRAEFPTLDRIWKNPQYEGKAVWSESFALAARYDALRLAAADAVPSVEAREVTEALADAQNRLWSIMQECEGHRYGQSGYDLTLDHIYECADEAREKLAAYDRVSSPPTPGETPPPFDLEPSVDLIDVETAFSDGGRAASDQKEGA